MTISAQTKGVLALVTLSLGFAAIAICTRYLTASITALQQLYIALTVGFVFSLPTFRQSHLLQKLRTVSRKDWQIMIFRVTAGYLIAGPLYRTSVGLTKISNVTFIQSAPLTAILGFLLFKEKLTLGKGLCLILAYIGVLLISVKATSAGFSFGTGELLSLISAILFATTFVACKWQSAHLNDQEIAQILLLLGACLTLGASILLGEKLVWTWTFTAALSLFFTGLFNALNLFLINYGFKQVEAAIAGNILTLESVFALLLAFLFYRELPTLKEALGGFTVLLSVIAMNHLQTQKPRFPGALHS